MLTAIEIEELATDAAVAAFAAGKNNPCLDVAGWIRAGLIDDDSVEDAFIILRISAIATRKLRRMYQFC